LSHLFTKRVKNENEPLLKYKTIDFYFNIILQALNNNIYNLQQ